ncbi:hypothetical protein Ocin01_16870, partial [Orchesella cincta]
VRGVDKAQSPYCLKPPDWRMTFTGIFLKRRMNRNGCPISATFYISHELTDYSKVQNLAVDGYKIASHSVPHSI